MANLYVTEPQTEGKLLLVTSKGEIEVELWPKEAPIACRNIIALALEGYYDDCIFHRIVPGFCIQTGDPTGTGMGGESFYGESFENEPHQRLRFSRRGMLAMANTGEAGSNDSQFFITLDATPELQGKYTIFGRVAGQTIYNVLTIAEAELSKDEPDRPVYPPKLLRIDVLQNPFNDIVPRITREERLQQQRARKEAAQRKAKEQTRKSVKKNTKLLSFGEAEEADAEVFKGPKSSHDLLADKRLSKNKLDTASLDPPPSKAKEPAKPAPPSKEEKQEEEKVDLAALRAAKSKSSAADKIKDLEASIRGLNKKPAEQQPKKQKRGKELLQAEREKYKKGKTKDDTMDLLAKFQERMRGNAKPVAARQAERDQAEEEEEEAKEYGASDDETDWRNHKLDAGGLPISGKEDKFTIDDYEVLDPRQDGKAPTKEKKREGKRGRDWVEERNWETKKRNDRHEPRRERR